MEFIVTFLWIMHWKFWKYFTNAWWRNIISFASIPYVNLDRIKILIYVNKFVLLYQCFFPLLEKCPNMEYFLVCILYKYRKIQTTKNSVFGHFFRSVQSKTSASFPLLVMQSLMVLKWWFYLKKKKKKICTKWCYISRTFLNENVPDKVLQLEKVLIC